MKRFGLWGSIKFRFKIRFGFVTYESGFVQSGWFLSVVVFDRLFIKTVKSTCEGIKFEGFLIILLITTWDT